MEFLQRFLLVLVWILPFEIRDLKYDLEQLGTIPQRVGVTQTKILGIVLLIASSWYGNSKEYINLQTSLLALMITVVVVAAFLFGSPKKDKSRYFASFWVEGSCFLVGGAFVV